MSTVKALQRERFIWLTIPGNSPLQQKSRQPYHPECTRSCGLFFQFSWTKEMLCCSSMAIVCSPTSPSSAEDTAVAPSARTNPALQPAPNAFIWLQREGVLTRLFKQCHQSSEDCGKGPPEAVTAAQRLHKWKTQCVMAYKGHQRIPLWKLGSHAMVLPNGQNCLLKYYKICLDHLVGMLPKSGMGNRFP